MKWTILLFTSLATLALAHPPIGGKEEVINVNDPKEQAQLVKLITATPTASGNSSLFLEAKKQLNFNPVYDFKKVVGATRQIVAGNYYRANVTFGCHGCLMDIQEMLGLQFRAFKRVHLEKARLIRIKK